MTTDKRETELEAAAREEAKQEFQTQKLIDERDKAEECIGKIYQLVTGDYPEWSNNFGYTEAIDIVDQTVFAKEQEIGRLQLKSDELDSLGNFFLRTEGKVPRMIAGHAIRLLEAKPAATAPEVGRDSEASASSAEAIANGLAKEYGSIQVLSSYHIRRVALGAIEQYREAVTSASEVRLREELDAALRELDWIDSVLARRPALADQPTRAAKIEHAISTAAKADQLQSRLAAAERELEAVKGERDKRADELRVLRAIAEGCPDAGRLFGHCCEDALRIEKVLSYALPVSPAQGDGK